MGATGTAFPAHRSDLQQPFALKLCPQRSHSHSIMRDCETVQAALDLMMITLAPVEAKRQYCAVRRADSIVRDAEIVRAALVPKETLGGRWTILGQSFGGFCCVTYLSVAPQGEPLVLRARTAPASAFPSSEFSACRSAAHLDTQQLPMMLHACLSSLTHFLLTCGTTCC